MKRFVLADGDVLLSKPDVIGGIYRPYWPKIGYGDPQFHICLAGVVRTYRSRWLSEVKRERARLIAFNWED